MTFSRQFPSGVADDDPIPGSKLTAIDLNLSRALDGFGGGKYAPSAPLNISGKGLKVGDSGDDAPLVTAASKWLGPMLDLSISSAITGNVLTSITAIEERLLFATGTANDTILVSLNDGFSWIDTSANIAAPQGIALSCCASSYVLGVTVPGILVAGGNSAKVYYSTDAGATWTFATLPGAPTQINALHFDKLNGLFVAIGKTAGAPYIATSPAGAAPTVWTQRTVPGAITGSNIGLSIAQIPGGRLVASWAGQTNVAYSDNGTTWTASTTALTSGKYGVRYGDGVFVAIDLNATSHAYVSSDGSTWTSSGVTKQGTAAVAANAFSSMNGVFIYTDAAELIYYSIDRCATWIQTRYGVAGYLVNAPFLKTIQTMVFFVVNDGANTTIARSRRLGLSDGSA